VGVAIPGLVNDTTVLRTVDIGGLEGWVPSNMVEFANVPVKILNDADVPLSIYPTPNSKAAGTEAYFGCNSDDTIATLVVGTGVGSSFLVDGRPLRGKNGYAGEIGVCPIGGLGPVDYRSGGKWLLRDRMDAISPEEMVVLVAQEDPAALNAIKESGTNFGYILATVINIFNPGKIVLGGGTLRWPGYLDTALQVAKDNSMDLLWQSCTFDVRDHLLVAKGAARAVSLILQEAK
jgi:predicted NBD/HSP70 family sugar kinase